MNRVEVGGRLSVAELEFGRYRLIEQIGRGGMGEVWRAHDTVTERTVALKVLPAQFADDAVFQERFRREARSAAALDEPHVVPIYDFGEIDGRLFVTMRLIRGRDLQAILSNGPIDLARGVGIIDQVAEALHAAHEVNLIHRDVKPSNILVTDNDFAYLIDFGIARAAGQTGLTSSSTVIGTWAYMAPERITEGQTDARADLYALACVLYECLTGLRPFGGDNLEQQIGGHIGLPPPRASDRRPDVPAELDAVIAKGMAKDPDHRYATTRELARAAREALSAPSHPSTPARTAPWARPADPPSFPPEASAAPLLQPVWPQQPANIALAAASYHPSSNFPVSPYSGPTGWRGPQAAPPPRRSPWSRQRWAALIASIAVLVIGAAVAGYVLWPQPVPSPSRPAAPSPVAESALQELLLKTDDVNDIMGAALMTVVQTNTTMDPTAFTVDKAACLPLKGPLLAPVYADKGWRAFRENELEDREAAGNWTHHVDQGVVQFASAQDANAFLTASAQGWQGCSNQTFTASYTGRAEKWTVGPVSNTNGILSARTKQAVSGNSAATTCQRALAAANNVVVDVVACSDGSLDANSYDYGAKILRQIVAKVPTT
jgi:serine/threonine protein kinase